ncbi:MAG: DMT family transporter, partial [Proteobacteria bacterium]|nr:DMT family transporter [Pseudomonadota bacterium]
YAISCALLWAIAIILFRKGGEQIQPVALNLFKGTVGLPLFFFSLWAFSIPFFPEDVSTKDTLILLASGAVGIAIADTLFFASLNRLGAGRSAIVNCLYSPFVVLCSAVYLGEPRGPGLVPAVLLMGLAIAVGTWNPEREKTSANSRRELRKGVILGAAAMFLMAAAIVAAKPVLDHTHPLWSTTVRLTGGVLLLALQASLPRWRRDVVRIFTPSPLWRITVPAGILGAYLAMFLWILGMTYARTNVASVLNQTSTLWVLVFATLFLREPFTSRRVMAILVGATAAWLATL